MLGDDGAFDVLDVVHEIANEQTTSVAHIALAWILAQPTVTAPIIGARTVGQLHALLGAVDVALSENEIERLSGASAGY